MADISQLITSQIPGHIVENHPRFVDFLRAYYEWLSQDGNPYGRLKNHMDYMSFEKSLDSYVEMMKQEYLSGIPEEVLLDKELFIKWSKKFNLARGSHQSYAFLFKLLFDEDGVSIYLPKENILKTSDGEWIDNEYRMFITNNESLDKFKFQVLAQEREIGGGVFEYSYAVIQDAKPVRYGRYTFTELRLSDFDGDFDPEYPVYTELGGESWILPVSGNITITNKGSNYLESDRLLAQEPGLATVEREANEEGRFDTRITSRFVEDQISVFVNETQITDFEYNGRFILSSFIGINDTVRVEFPSYQGYLNVNEVNVNGGIESINIVEPIISSDSTFSITSDSSYGNGIQATSELSSVLKVNGYFKDTKGNLSSNMYLTDSFYYQDYSYAIQTVQDISKYRDVVKDLLHPAGFQYFGIMNVINIVEMIISLEEADSETILPFNVDSLVKYSLGPNYSFFDRFKAGLSKRLYRLYHFRGTGTSPTQFNYVEDGVIENVQDYVDSIVYPEDFYYDQNQMTGDYFVYLDENYMEDQEEYVDSVLYLLYDKSLEKAYGQTSNYFINDYFAANYFFQTNNIVVPQDGWMTKHNFSDYYLYIPQDYSAEVESSNQYFETGYTTQR